MALLLRKDWDYSIGNSALDCAIAHTAFICELSNSAIHPFTYYLGLVHSDILSCWYSELSDATCHIVACPDMDKNRIANEILSMSMCGSKEITMISFVVFVTLILFCGVFMTKVGSRLEAKVPAFNYLGGEDVIEKLKEVSGVEKDIQLADVFGVPKNTIATWRKRGLIPYELLLRASLHFGADLRSLSLGEGELFPYGDFSESRLRVPFKKLMKGALKEVGSFNLDNSQVELLDVEPEKLEVIRDSDLILIIDTSDSNVASGRYLFDIDGVYTINQAQRLPGKNLSIDFNGTAMQISEEEIKTLGRVVMSMAKE
ncbi:helix-turn-helix domain-containing protein [Grimontia marina]|nr:helix-turn-helix domain-containing protein [Grimontia marina]